MTPLLRTIIAALLGSALALWIGVSIAQEEYLIASLACGVSVWGLLAWRGGPLPEAWLVAFVLFGYIIGNRGFAQLSLTNRLPLLPAEVALLVGVAATLVRMALRQSAAVRRDALNYAIIIWLLLGAARLWTDVRAHGAVALRDFATVYYALFFFVAQALAQQAASVRLLRHALVAASVLLPVTYFLFERFGDFFLQQVTFRGVPLLFYKDDLVAAYLFVGVFVVATLRAWPLLLRTAIATACVASAFTIDSSRAAIVGLAVTCGWWAIARRWEPLRLLAIFVPIATAVLLLIAFSSKQDFERSRIYALYEHVASVVDVTGSRRYTSADRQFVGDNNRFRLSWWRAVAEETWAGGPVFGLGFGASLTERFTRTYELDLGEDFSARSPHSVFFTVLGRMGVTGLLAFTAILVAMVHRTRLLARIARTNDGAVLTLGWWSTSWVLFVSGSFGVVLEGPMGAVIFWTALGIANSATSTWLREAKDEDEEIVGSAGVSPASEKMRARRPCSQAAFP